MSKHNVQVIFSVDELYLINEAAARKGVSNMRGFIANKARLLLLSWAVEICQTPGAVRGSVCACGAPNAVWLNTITKFFVCEACAERLNVAGNGPHGFPPCTLGGPDRYVPVAETEAALERALAAENASRVGKIDRFVSTVLAAVDQYRKKEEPSPNADMIGLFKTAG